MQPVPAAVTALHFGSISLIPEPCGGTYEALAKRAHKSKVICIDPNIRASLISRQKRKQHQIRLFGIMSIADIIKISDEDVLWITKSNKLANFGKAWVYTLHSAAFKMAY